MFGGSCPLAAAHVRAAVTAHARLRELWAAFLADERIAEFSVTDSDGRGRIVVAAQWPDDTRAGMTEALRTFVDELWACLDCVVTETVHDLEIFHRPRDVGTARFFPVADSPDGFAALLAEGRIDGVLSLQRLLVEDCQPFRDSPAPQTIRKIRIALARLLEWACRLDDGSLVGAWVTPVDPEIRVDGSRSLLTFEAAAPSILDDEAVVATYRVTPGSGGVTSRTGSYVDFALPDGFHPTSADDTFDQQMTDTLKAAVGLAALFTDLSSSAGPVRHVADRADGDVEAWSSVDRSPRRWAADELRALQDSDIGLGVVRDSDELTFLVTTEHGVFERRIPAVSPLNPNIRTGPAAELAAHNAAATWGLPDFVLPPTSEHHGKRNREISDGILFTGDLGAVLQVKNRESPGADPAKEASWVDKKVAEAARQIHGTVRRLRSSPVEMTNGRSRSVRVDGMSVDWVGVVIIDHPAPPSERPLVDHGKPGTGVVTLLRRDWEFLFDQLRSTRQVVEYLHRVAGPAPTLGGEPQRYLELAIADRDAEPDPPPAHLVGETRSLPRLPLEPANHAAGPAGGILRMICEDIARAPFDGEEHERIAVLAAVDGLLVGHRRELGQLLLDELKESRTVDDGAIRWRMRRYDHGLDGPHLGFGVCSTSDQTSRDAFRSWVELRQHERIAVTGSTDSLTVGVLLAPRRDGLREWDTTLFAIRGDPGLDEDELLHRQRLWNSAE